MKILNARFLGTFVFPSFDGDVAGTGKVRNEFGFAWPNLNFAVFEGFHFFNVSFTLFSLLLFD